jgi:hypothetical protein
MFRHIGFPFAGTKSIHGFRVIARGTDRRFGDSRVDHEEANNRASRLKRKECWDSLLE